MISLQELNGVAPEEFVASLDGIFEHSAWVARDSASSRPFGSRLELLDALRGTVERASGDLQLALIQAHPQLGIGGRAPAPLTAASAREQRRAGLDACTAADLGRLNALNAAYVAKFGIPFILAVRGHDPASIIASCERRLAHPAPLERRTALEEIGKIASFRLADAVATPSGAEIEAMQLHMARLAADSTARHALLREWMLAAHLDLTEARGELLGRRRAALPTAPTLLLGVQQDAGGVLHYEGLDATLLGIAVAQQLRQQGRELAFDLAIIGRPAVASDAIPAPWRGATLEAVAGYGEFSFARVRRRVDSGVSADRDATFGGERDTAASMASAARDLEDFLLRQAQWFDNKAIDREGPSLHHG